MRYFGLLCCLVSVLLRCGTAQLLGGFDGEKTVTKGSEVSQLFDRVKTDIKNALDCFNVGYTGPPTALKYIQQVVAGMNYIVSVQIGTGIIHVKIYKDLNDNVSLTGIVTNPGTNINPNAEYKQC